MFFLQAFEIAAKSLNFAVIMLFGRLYCVGERVEGGWFVRGGMFQNQWRRNELIPVHIFHLNQLTVFGEETAPFPPPPPHPPSASHHPTTHLCSCDQWKGSQRILQANRPLSNYASVPVNNNLKSRLRAKFSYICCIFSPEASTLGCCSRELKRNWKVLY